MPNITTHPNDGSANGVRAYFHSADEIDETYNKALLGRVAERMLSVSYDSPSVTVWLNDTRKPAFLYPLYYTVKDDVAVLHVHVAEERAQYYFVAVFSEGAWDVPPNSVVVRVTEDEEGEDDFGALPLSTAAQLLGL